METLKTTPGSLLTFIFNPYPLPTQWEQGSLETSELRAFSFWQTCEFKLKENKCQDVVATMSYVPIHYH